MSGQFPPPLVTSGDHKCLISQGPSDLVQVYVGRLNSNSWANVISGRDMRKARMWLLCTELLLFPAFFRIHKQSLS